MDRVAIAAGLLRQGAAEPRLADAARPRDEQITFVGDPAAGRQLLEQRFVEFARRSIVDVLNRGLVVTQLGIAQPALEPLRATLCSLAIVQQGQPFGGC